MAFKKIALAVLILALIIVALFFGIKKLKNNPPDEPAGYDSNKTEKKIEASIEASTENLVPAGQDVFSGNKDEYKKMVGDWDTGCLIANPKNPLVEKHLFSFKENGTAQHFRLSGQNCETIQKDRTAQNYKLEVPEKGKINFIALDKNSDNTYDIYKFEGNILYFGHGPRDWYPLSLRNFGGSPETRFDALNTFLKYKKQTD